MFQFKSKGNNYLSSMKGGEKMKKNLYLFMSVLIIFLFYIGTVHCKSFEFSINANSINVCPCRTSVVVANLKNLLPENVDYSVNSDLDWVTPLPQKFELSPYGEENIYLYITPSCDTQPGKYIAKISIYSYNAPEDDYVSLPLSINVLPCNSFKLHIPEEVSGCPGESKNINVVIQNTGVEKENIEIDFMNETKKISIEAGKNKTVKFSLKIKNESYEANVKVRLLNGYGSKTKIIKIVPLICGKINVEKNSEIYQVCEGETKKVNITLVNNGEVAEKLKIFPYGECNTTSKIMEIGPGEEKTIGIMIDGNINKKYGSCTLYIVGPDFSKKYEISYVVTKCGNQISVVTIPNKIELCPNEKKTIIVAVKNLGNIEKKIILSTTAGELGTNKINVKRKNEALTYLKIKASNLKPGDNIIVISAYGDGYKDNTTLNAILLPENICKGFSISPEEENVNILNAGAHKLVKIKITNVASSPEKYYIYSKGSSWIHIVPKELYLKPGETGYIYAYISPDYSVSKGIYEETVIISNGNVRRSSKIVVFYGINESSKIKKFEKEKNTNAITTLVEVNSKQYKNVLAELIFSIILAGLIFLFLIGRDLLKDFSKLLNGNKNNKDEEKKKKNKKKEDKRKKAVKEIEEIKKILEKV